MQAVCRTRRQLVSEASAIKTQIRQLMSIVFREFQGLVNAAELKQQKIFASFWNRKSQMIMRYYPLPDQLLQLGETGLRQLAAAEKVEIEDQEIELLLIAAERALMLQSMDHSWFLGEQIKFRLKQLETLEEQIAHLEFQVEEMLVKNTGRIALNHQGC